MPLLIRPSEWIIFDTSVVRGIVAGEPEAIDLASLAAVRDKHPIALGDGAPAETFDWLIHRAPEEMFARVAPALDELNPLLDPEFPIAPGGGVLSAFAGLASFPEGSNRRDLSREAKAIWD